MTHMTLTYLDMPLLVVALLEIVDQLLVPELVDVCTLFCLLIVVTTLEVSATQGDVYSTTGAYITGL